MAPENINVEGFTDSHAHLADPAFAGDCDEVIERARNAGAKAIVCIGSGGGIGDVLGAARGASAVAARHLQLVWFTAGVHPHDASGFDPARDNDAIRGHVTAGAVAIGECGLDYHYDNSPRAQQLATFRHQLDIARDTHMPVVVHTRDAEDDTLSMVVEAGADGVTGVLHCYTGSHALAEAAIAAGWYISFSGVVTFRKWTDDALLRLVPSSRILAESDSPYLAPVPYRGRRNEPGWVAFTVARLAAARGITAGEMGAMVSDNARQLFKLA